MTFLVITLIAFITAVAIYFINDSRKAWSQQERTSKFTETVCTLYRYALTAYFAAEEELQKYKRPRDPKTGRWV